MKKLSAGLALVAILATGCNSYNNKRGFGDSPVGKNDDSPAEIVNFPDTFANIANKCDGHGHRIFVTTRNAPPVVISDSSCSGGVG